MESERDAYQQIHFHTSLQLCNGFQVEKKEKTVEDEVSRSREKASVTHAILYLEKLLLKRYSPSSKKERRERGNECSVSVGNPRMIVCGRVRHSSHDPVKPKNKPQLLHFSLFLYTHTYSEREREREKDDEISIEEQVWSTFFFLINFFL